MSNISHPHLQAINIKDSSVEVNNINKMEIYLIGSQRIVELQHQINRINNEITVENINIRNESFNRAFKEFLETINNINNNGNNTKNGNLNKEDKK